MKELKAIEILSKMKDDYYFGYRPKEIQEALAELEAIQSKLQSLEAYCEKAIAWNRLYVQDSARNFETGKLLAFQDILNKLRS